MRFGAFLYVVLMYLHAVLICGSIPIFLAVEQSENVYAFYTTAFVVGATISITFTAIVASLYKAESEQSPIMLLYLIGVTLIWANVLFPEHLLNLTSKILPEATNDVVDQFLTNPNVERLANSRLVYTLTLTLKLTVASTLLFLMVGSIQTLSLCGGFRAFFYSLLQFATIGLSCGLFAYEAKVLPEPVMREFSNFQHLIRIPLWSMLITVGVLSLISNALFLRSIAVHFGDKPTIEAATGYRTFTILTAILTAVVTSIFVYFNDTPIIQSRGKLIDIDYVRLSSLAAIGLLILIHATTFQRSLADLRDIINIRRQPT